MDLRASRVRGADVVRTSKRVARGLTAGVVCVQLTGCLALSLSSRGAPEDEWLRFERKLDAVDLPMGHGGHEEAQTTLRLWTTIPTTGWLHGYPSAENVSFRLWMTTAAMMMMTTCSRE